MGLLAIVLFISGFLVMFLAIKIDSLVPIGIGIVMVVIGLIMALLLENQDINDFKQECINIGGEITSYEEYNAAAKVHDTDYFCMKDEKLVDKY